MGFPPTVLIREVGPREGFQTLPRVVTTDKKLELISLLNGTGVTEIEITSFVRPDRVPQMADAEDVARRFERRPGVRYTALYLNEKGFERAEAVGTLDNRGWFASAVSATFLKRNNNLTPGEVRASIPQWLATFRRAQKHPYGLMLSTAFGCHYEGLFSTSQVVGVVREFLQNLEDAGGTLREVCLADTVGLGSPEAVRRLVGELSARLPTVDISLHFHDTRGLAIANIYAGLCEGVRIFEASVGGMGGCPFTRGAAGNVATEEVVLLCHELGIHTGIDLNSYIRVAGRAEEIAGERLPSKLIRRVGSGAR